MTEQNKEQNIQNDFLNRARKENCTVQIFLTNGKKLNGRIKSFDRFTIILEHQNREQIIFKHAISTVSIGKVFGNYMNFDDSQKQSREDKGENKRES